MKIAVVGGGAAGMYTVDALTKSSLPLEEIVIIERLPVIGGLVRNGVAPDHPKIKAVGELFLKILSRSSVRLVANVDVGVDVSVDELMQAFDAVFLTTGAWADKRLDIPGSDLANIFACRAFVGWYNADPGRDRALRPAGLGKEVVIVGGGNVAIDIARLLLARKERYAGTDISRQALSYLEDQSPRRVRIVIRGMPRDAKFAPTELEELIECAGGDAAVVCMGDAWDAVDEDGEEDFRVRQNLTLLRRAADAAAGDADATQPSLSFYFGFTPSRYLSDDDGAVSGVGIVTSAVGAEAGVLAADLVVEAVGFGASPIAGVPYEQGAAKVSNADWRVLGTTGTPIPGLYVAGWAKRGPNGVIGTNRKCAESAVRALVEDLDAGSVSTSATEGSAWLLPTLRSRRVDVIEAVDFTRIDERERESGLREGRPRVKFETVEEMLAVKGGGRD